jgi:hypothetical protein
MSEYSKKIDIIKRTELGMLLSRCTNKQKELFSRMYPQGIEKMTDEQLYRAAEQIEATLKGAHR